MTDEGHGTDDQTADHDTTSGATGDAWDAAVDQYRNVAKWAIGAFGAIGALLAGAAPLSGLGDVASNRVAYVLWGGAVGVLGSAIAIVTTVISLVPRTVYRSEIRPRRQGRIQRTFHGLGPLENLLVEHPNDVLPDGITSLDVLDDAISNIEGLLADAQVEAERLPDDQAQARIVEVWKDQLEQYQSTWALLLRIGRFEKARTGFRLAFCAMLLGAIGAAIGTGLLLYGINSKTESATPAAQDAPSLVTVRLTAQGRALLKPTFGTTCLTPALAAVLLGGSRTATPWDVLTIPTPGCPGRRFTLTEAMGTIS